MPPSHRPTVPCLRQANQTISGTLPSNWTLPAGLGELTLARLSLTGTIPPAFLDSLTTVVLFENELTGTVPSPLPPTLQNLHLVRPTVSKH